LITILRIETYNAIIIFECIVPLNSVCTISATLIFLCISFVFLILVICVFSYVLWILFLFNFIHPYILFIFNYCLLAFIIKRSFIQIWNLNLILLNFWILWRWWYISHNTIILNISLWLIRLWLFFRFDSINNSSSKISCFLSIIVNYLALNFHYCITIFTFIVLIFFTFRSFFNLLFFSVENSYYIVLCNRIRSF
jgi:hypothetical protein